MTDYKKLCAELVAIENALMGGATLASNQGQALDGYSALANFRLLANRVRAELAKPEPEWPTDEEILELMPQQFQDDLATVSRMAAYGAGEDIKPGLFQVSLNTGALDFARAVLARWGNRQGFFDSSTAQPADGEVAELVLWLRKEADDYDFIEETYGFIEETLAPLKCRRAADLLERLSSPQPIPVAERLPGPGEMV